MVKEIFFRTAKTFILVLILIMISSLVIAANNPGHDSLYIEEIGNSELTGTFNVSQNFSVEGGRTVQGNLEIYGDDTVPTPTSGAYISGYSNGNLYLYGQGDVYLKSLVGGDTVYIGLKSLTATDLNVSGALYVQSSTLQVNGQDVCLADGTNCIPVGGASVGGGWTNTSENTSTTLNVGIGTTKPNATLHVNGDIIAKNDMNVTAGNDICIVGGNCLSDMSSADGDKYVSIDAAATPGYLGAANNDGVLRTDGTVITYADGGDFITLAIGSNQIGDSQLAYDTGQALTTSSSPVFNKVNATTDLCITGGNCLSTAGGSGDIVGPSGATDNAIARYDTTTGKLLQDSAVTIDDTGIITGASITSTQLTDGGTIGFDWVDGEVADSLTVNGGTIGSNIITAASTWTLAGNLEFAQDTTDNITFDSGTLFIDSKNNRVGIGTTSPNQKLHVEGNVNVTGTLYAHNISGNSPITFVDSSGAELMTIEEDGNLSFDTNTLFVDSSSNFVGIGTATPSATLQTTGRIQVTGNTAPVSGTGLEIGFSTTGVLLSYNRTGSQFKSMKYNALEHNIQVSGTNALVINSSGDTNITGDLAIDGASTNFRNSIKAVDGSGSGIDADTLDGQDSSAFGDATAASQTTILNRIGTNTDSGSMSDTLFAGQQYIADRAISTTDIGAVTGSTTGSLPEMIKAVYDRVDNSYSACYIKAATSGVTGGDNYPACASGFTSVTAYTYLEGYGTSDPGKYYDYSICCNTR